MTRATGVIHAARIEKSRRLLRLLGILSDRKPHSTLDLQRRTNGMAIHTDISEIRAGKHTIDCSAAWDYRLRKNIYWYRLVA